MNFKKEKINLFKVESDYAIINLIAEDCIMNEDFDFIYSSMSEDLKNIIKEYKLKYPETIVYYQTYEHDVINLIVKENYTDKPKYYSISKSLEKAIYLCKRRNIKKIAILKDDYGLKWLEIENMIKDCFKDLDIEILVCCD